MESGLWNTIPCSGFTNRNDINKHVWYSISSLVSNLNVSFESKFGIGSNLPRKISVLALNTKFTVDYQA